MEKIYIFKASTHNGNRIISFDKNDWKYVNLKFETFKFNTSFAKLYINNISKYYSIEFIDFIYEGYLKFPSIINIVSIAKQKYPDKKIVIVENSIYAKCDNLNVVTSDLSNKNISDYCLISAKGKDFPIVHFSVNSKKILPSAFLPYSSKIQTIEEFGCTTKQCCYIFC